MMKQETNIGNGALWASAFILGAMVIFSASQHTPVAVADNVISSEGFTMISTASGQGGDYLYVIDDHNSMLLVYDIPDPQNRQFIRPVASWSLPAMFHSVRN